jgi:hypothetical protein
VAAKAGAPQQSNVVTIPTASGSKSSPSIEVATNPSDGPLVVEQIRTKDGARAATRGTTLVTQGDKVVAVIKNRAHHIDVNSDIHDEATLEGR